MIAPVEFPAPSRESSKPVWARRSFFDDFMIDNKLIIALKMERWDPTTALMVVEMMRDLGWKSDLTQFKDRWGWDFKRETEPAVWKHHAVCARTIPRAICKAAMQALGLVLEWSR